MYLANAKVSARQPWYIRHNSNSLNGINVIYTSLKSYFSVLPSLTMRVYLHSFSRSYLPKMRSSAKFRENLNFLQFKVNRKRICNFLLVISGNFGFRDIDALS